MTTDDTNPDHYKRLDPEPITVIEAWNLGFCEGNALKYLARAGFKPGQARDLDLAKARWYIDRAIRGGESFGSEEDLDYLLASNEEMFARVAALEHELAQWKAAAKLVSAISPVHRGLVELRDAEPIETCRRCHGDGFKTCVCDF